MNRSCAYIVARVYIRANIIDPMRRFRIVARAYRRSRVSRGRYYGPEGAVSHKRSRVSQLACVMVLQRLSDGCTPGRKLLTR